MTLKEKALFVANALTHLAKTMDNDNRDVPRRYIRAIESHAIDLRESAEAHGETATAMRDRMLQGPAALDLLKEFRERYGNALELQSAYDVTYYERELHRVIQAFIAESLTPWQKTLSDVSMVSVNPLRFDMLPTPQPLTEEDPTLSDVMDQLDKIESLINGLGYK